MNNNKYYLGFILSIISISFLCIVFLLTGKHSPAVPVDEQSSKIVAESVSRESASSIDESSAESLEKSEEESKESIGEIDKENLPFFNSIDELMTTMLEKYDIDTSNTAIAYYNFNSNESFQLNSDIAMMAASTNKVTTAVMFTDLVNQSSLTWDTLFPYNPGLYEEGGGTVTNGVPKPSYTLEELVYESLYYSDNTAWNMLIDWYYRYIGDFQQGLKIASGVEFTDPNIDIINYATADMLLSILHKVATQPEYEFIKETMLESQEGIFLKREVVDGFGAKYGQYEDNFHDIGFYLQDGVPQYLIVVLTRNGAGNELFLGDLNLQLRQFNEDQFHSF